MPVNWINRTWQLPKEMLFNAEEERPWMSRVEEAGH